MDALKLLKSRLKIQHEKLDDELKVVVGAAKEHLIDAGIDVENKKRENRILNLQVDIAKFYYENKKNTSSSKETIDKLPANIMYEINNLYFSQWGDK